MRIKIKYFTLLAVAYLSACNKADETEQSGQAEETSTNNLVLSAEQFKNMALKLENVASMPFSTTISTSGMVDVPPENVAMVSSAIGGVIKNITHNVLPGKYVKKGMVLATAQSMDLIQLQQDYLEKYLAQDLLNQEYERQKQLVDQDAGVRRKLQEAESAWKLNKAAISALEAKLKLANVNIENLRTGKVNPTLLVIAPISGYIKNTHVNTGTSFAANDKLFEIISKEHLHVELKIFEKDAAFINEGQVVSFQDPIFPSGGATGKVFLTAKNFDEDTRTVNVHVHFDNASSEQYLTPGQYLQAKIYLKNKQQNVIPESAILREESGDFIYYLKSNNAKEYVFEKIPVKLLGIESGKAAVQTDNLRQNIVVEGVSLLAGMGGAGEEE